MLPRILFLVSSILGQYFEIRVSSKASHVRAIGLQRSLIREYLILASTHKPRKLSPMRNPSNAGKGVAK
jgi:hypothetical protein